MSDVMSIKDVKKPNKPPQKTQGETKMERYIDDLVRNDVFRREIKGMRKSCKPFPEGKYNNWTKEEQREHDYFNKEAGEIIREYEKLKKRCKKLFNQDKYFDKKKYIADVYFLSGEQIDYAENLISSKNDKKAKSFEYIKNIADLDMCSLYDAYEDELSPWNKGEEIIYLNPSREIRLIAYPIAIGINPLASKRDILDFVEKKWPWIEYNFLYSYSDGGKLRARKRKYSQELFDFIWDNRFLKTKEISIKLDEKFPDNTLAYYEITKIIKLERDRRVGE